ncbi:glyoxalase superfamily protein [Xanthobacter sp. TB0139]|uniref:glyoxalase superfamily protein n=1 Tax=Xanthobacter sp. TB0139 TaxID=3459178 RepID=UPI0040391F01
MTASEQPIAFAQVIPILRIFDIEKAHQFYLGFLGFSVDWEHRHGANFPLYLQISRQGLKLHLSEHAGDATPGSNMCVPMKGIRTFHRERTDQNYRYMKPELQHMDGRLELQVTDPFGNRIRFMEHAEGSEP